MPDLKDIREYMRRMAEEDRSRRSVRVFGATLEEALTQATIELGVPVRKIEYEILEKGSRLSRHRKEGPRSVGVRTRRRG